MERWKHSGTANHLSKNTPQSTSERGSKCKHRLNSFINYIHHNSSLSQQRHLSLNEYVNEGQMPSPSFPRQILHHCPLPSPAPSTPLPRNSRAALVQRCLGQPDRLARHPVPINWTRASLSSPMQVRSKEQQHNPKEGKERKKEREEGRGRSEHSAPIPDCSTASLHAITRQGPQRPIPHLHSQSAGYMLERVQPLSAPPVFPRPQGRLETELFFGCWPRGFKASSAIAVSKGGKGCLGKNG